MNLGGRRPKMWALPRGQRPLNPGVMAKSRGRVRLKRPGQACPASPAQQRDGRRYERQRDNTGCDQFDMCRDERDAAEIEAGCHDAHSPHGGTDDVDDREPARSPVSAKTMAMTRNSAADPSAYSSGVGAMSTNSPWVRQPDENLSAVHASPPGERGASPGRPWLVARC